MGWITASVETSNPSSLPGSPEGPTLMVSPAGIKPEARVLVSGMRISLVAGLPWLCRLVELGTDLPGVHYRLIGYWIHGNTEEEPSDAWRALVQFEGE
jgi:hypothetical protein